MKDGRGCREGVGDGRWGIGANPVAGIVCTLLLIALIFAD